MARPATCGCPPSTITAGWGDGRSWKSLIRFIRWHSAQPVGNNHGGFGRWAFIEITDPWDAKNTIRAMLRGQAVEGVGPL
jgi:hypothetical protein